MNLNVWMKWMLVLAVVILMGATFLMATQNKDPEKGSTQPDSVVDWIKSIDGNPPKDTQTATFALG